MNAPRPMPRFKNCFVCGNENPQGLKLKFTYEGDKVNADFSLNSLYRGYADRIHGGIVAAVIDEAMCWAAIVKFKRLYCTLELNIRYYLPILSDKYYTVEAISTKGKSKLALCEGKIFDKTGTIFVSASGKYLVVPEEQEMIKYLYREEGEKRSSFSLEQL